jgi:hypothetical protein
MIEKKIIKRVILNSTKHSRTGFTLHVIGNQEEPFPDMLQIELMRQAGDSTEMIYLIHYDKVGNQLTDTYHDSIMEAEEQAKNEFLVAKNDWEEVVTDWENIS